MGFKIEGLIESSTSQGVEDRQLYPQLNEVQMKHANFFQHLKNCVVFAQQCGILGGDF